MATAGWASTARCSPGIRSWAGDGRDRIDEWMDLPEDDRMVGGGGGGSADGRDGVADDTVSGPVMEEDIDFLSSLVGADVAGISAHAGAGGARGNPPGKGGAGGGRRGGVKTKQEVEAGVQQGMMQSIQEHSTKDAVQHLEELKLKEIAQERAVLGKMKMSTTKRMAETHRDRLIACCSHTETKKIVRQNEDEMNSVEQELDRMMVCPHDPPPPPSIF